MYSSRSRRKLDTTTGASKHPVTVVFLRRSRETNTKQESDSRWARIHERFILDRVADGARGSIPFGKLVLGTILHFIFIINAVECREREKKESEEGGEE